jgi:hypothetical protein
MGDWGVGWIIDIGASLEKNLYKTMKTAFDGNFQWSFSMPTLLRGKSQVDRISGFDPVLNLEKPACFAQLYQGLDFIIQSGSIGHGTTLSESVRIFKICQGREGCLICFFVRGTVKLGRVDKLSQAHHSWESILR